MATLLHRLGRWCAHHRLGVIAIWVAVLAITGTGMATLAKPLSNEFSIPGSRFEQVLDTLQQEIPEAAGTTGTVVFRNDDGFTDEQREAIAGAVQDWEDLDGVTSTDPFEAQAELDSAPQDITDGEAELEDARAQLEDGREQLEQGRADLEDSRDQLASGREQLEAGQAELDEQAATLQQSQEELDAQLQQLEDGVAAGQVPPAAEQQARAEIAAGQEQIDAGRQQLEAGQAQLDEQAQQLEAGEEQLADGEAELEDNAAQLDDAEDDIAQGEEDLAVARRMVDLSDGFRVVNEAGTVALTQVSVADAEGFIPEETTASIQQIGNDLEGDGLSVDFSKEITDDLSSLLGPGEVVGLVVAAVVLIVMLGSLVAAGLPILMALVGVGVGLTGALALSQWVDMQSITPVLALMLGLAVGIDYSLFLINRHRQQVRQGMPLRDSIALAVGTSGNAVTFAGLTVIIALVALTLTGIPFLGVMGIVAAATVAIAVLVAITLTPAMLSLIGDKVLPRRERAGGHRGKHEEDPAEEHADDPGRGWAARVQKHPWLAVVGVLAVVGALAWPTLDLRLGLPDGSSEPAGSTAYTTYDTVRDEFGAGANGPILVVAELDEPLAEGDTALMSAQADLGEELAEVDGVEQVLPAGVNDARDVLAFRLQPEGGPADASTEALVDRLGPAVEQIGEDQGATLGLTGQTVANIDISEQLADALPIYLVVVVGLSLILLLLVFRSILVPLLATGGFLLSVGAAFGAVVGVYQLGFASSFFGVNEAGPILSFLPILLIGILFGLAMDYQLFLVSAMREEKVHGKDARTAVVSGFNHSARVVTAAAIIMISVFAGFVWAHLTMVRPIGLGLAVGVLVDAFLVRMTLTPAVMSLLGERAWWIPRWLDRILPDVDVEGAKLERTLGISHDEQEPGEGTDGDRDADAADREPAQESEPSPSR
ncbi:Integral membrane protein [Serinicoccus hydrothermalis]|uniref:Integral membrane protein n=1 Tax=Serinicoccus hydrothermalis TaxID=1758689 RepID=A0A1B1NFI6_9MICO|nr:MMPL family transporter [Serinicoccus hydrothermalis]ANS80196.1 Integral membrane protein [Serinicoccus hydrothermalis]